MNDCIFCRIASGDIPSKIVYENDLVVAFCDLAPQAPVHVLIVPRQHASGLNALCDMPDGTLAALMRAAREVAKVMNIDQSGYRVVINCGEDACQSVQHLHLHVLGGRKLSESMT